MSECSADHLIARLAPAVIECFRGRGAIDFRVSPADPSSVHVCILFARGVDHESALAELKALARAADLGVDGEMVNQHSISIRVAAQPQGAEAAKPAAEIVMLPSAMRSVRQIRTPFPSIDPPSNANHPTKIARRLLRRVAATWFRWRSLLAPPRLSQPAK
jgi:hypothetical protein